MKFFMAALMALFAFTGVSALQPVQAEEMHKTKVVAFHSDTCGACKILGPRMKEAMGLINAEKVEVVKFDFTTDETKAASMAMAEQKGLSALYNSYAPKTGMILVLSKDGQIAAEIKKDETVGGIASKIVTAVADNS